MRIISKFKDYYDNIGFVDKSNVFNRTTYTKTYLSQHLILDSTDWLSYSWTRYFIANKFNHYLFTYNKIYNKSYVSEGKLFILGFCGDVHLLISIKLTDNINKQTQEILVKSSQELLDILSNPDYTKYFNLPHKRKQTKVALDNLSTITKAYESITLNTSLLKGLFQPNNSPIFIIDLSVPATVNRANNKKQRVVQFNPNLKELYIMKLYNTWEANQKISQYISNELANDCNPPDILTDSEKLTSHGFDNSSFKNPKTK